MASTVKFATEGSADHVEQRRLSSDDAQYDNIHLPSFLTSAIEESTEEVNHRVSVTVSTLVRPGHDAKAATAIEHAMSVREALRLYPKAVFFSMLLSLALVMDGYDKSLLTAFFGLPEFRRRFGTRLDNGTYQITARWMAGLQNGSIIGEIIGLIASGLVYERYGYKKTMLGALVMIICCIFALFFAQDLPTLLAGEILCGLSWGVFQTQTTTYAAEVTPVCLRAYLTSYVNLCWIMGQFVGAGVVRGMVERHNLSDWAYRIPFAVQWFWPIPLIIGVIFAPESPWYLVKKGRVQEARKSLLRLTSKKHKKFNVDQTVAMMVHTNELERQIAQGVSYRDCFRGTDLRRTEIVCCAWMIQVFCGISLGGSATYFLEQAGFDPTRAFSLNLGLPAIGFVGTILSWFLMRHVGRRTLYIWGLAVMLLVLITIGGLGVPPERSGLTWATGCLMFVFVFTYDITVGPVCYSLIAEISSTRLRVKSAVLARACYNICSIIANTLIPEMLNPNAWNLRGKAGFVWAGTCFACLVWTFFRLPEPKGLTFAELDLLFENKASARSFRRFRVALEESGYFSITESVDTLKPIAL
jgi:SP family general alpha glucoside:H+ symporter-like MFS transporter